MQQTCVDDVLMANYSVSNTKALNDITSQAVSAVISYKCEPFDCNGNGRCVNGSCVCNPGYALHVYVRVSRNTWEAQALENQMWSFIGSIGLGYPTLGRIPVNGFCNRHVFVNLFLLVRCPTNRSRLNASTAKRQTVRWILQADFLNGLWEESVGCDRLHRRWLRVDDTWRTVCDWRYERARLLLDALWRWRLPC